MNKFLILALLLLPCYAKDFEVYYPNTMKIQSTGYTDAYTDYHKIYVEGIDKGKHVLYLSNIMMNRYTTKVDANNMNFTFIPSKNIIGNIFTKELK